MNAMNSVPLPVWPDLIWGAIGMLIIAAIVVAIVLVVRRGRRE